MRLPRPVAVGAAGLALAGAAFAPASAAARPAHHPLVVAAGPIRQKVTAVPGRSVPVRFLLGNPGQVPVIVTLSERGFTELRNGTMVPAPAPPGTGKWLTFSRRTVVLPSGNVGVYVTARLTVPRNAQPGDFDLAGVFATRPASAPKKASGAVTVPDVFAEVIAVVPGKAIRHLVYSLTGGGLSLGGPVSFTATLAERGNTYVLDNDLAITGAGKVRLPGVLLLADSTRTMSAQWQPPVFCLPCTMRFGTASADVWSVPGLPILGVFLIGLAATGVVLVLRRNQHKARNRRHSRVTAMTTRRGQHRQKGDGGLTAL